MPEQKLKAAGGVGLALSGGGFRAALFHLGSLWRLNEIGWLEKLSEITSVSGGSITCGYLGLAWKRLAFDDSGVATNFADLIVKPLRAFCSKTIDVGTILGGIISSFHHPSELLASRYRRLFGGATLQDLPPEDRGPRFTIYASNLQTGASVRFSRAYLAEYHLGMIEAPTIPLAFAVAASSAFPPVFCPATLKLSPSLWQETDGADFFGDVSLRSRMKLGDGGIYDNLGLERVWDRYATVLVSDAGAPFHQIENSRLLDYSQLFRLKRSFDIVIEQTLALRKRRLVDDFKSNTRAGAYWGIATHIRDYDLDGKGYPSPLVADGETTRSLSRMRTRLNRFSDSEQELLINWGYALADAAMRRHVLGKNAQRGELPYAASFV